MSQGFLKYLKIINKITVAIKKARINCQADKDSPGVAEILYFKARLKATPKARYWVKINKKSSNQKLKVKKCLIFNFIC